jgi:hypothetical protein
VLVIGIFSYTFYFSSKSKSVWDLIPKDAVMVYEFGECEKCKEELSKTVIGEIVRDLFIPLDDSINRSLYFLLDQRNGKRVSVHLIGKNSFDVVFYFTKEELGLVVERLTLLKSRKDIRYNERILNDVLIKEFDFGSKTFSWTEVDGVGVGSFTSFLIEDVVRSSKSDEGGKFVNLVHSVYKLPKVNNDPGNLYIYFPNFTKWISAFNSRPLINDLATAGLLDIKVENNATTVNGFSRVDKSDKNQLLSYFEGQSPVEFNLKQLISNRTATIYAYGISDPNLLFNNLILGERKISFDSLQSATRLNLKELFVSVEGELAQCNIEGRGGFDKILLFKVKEKKLWMDALTAVSTLTESEDTVFFERYSEYEIKEIEAKNFSKIIFGGLVDGFKTSYYTTIGNAFILSNNLEQLKGYLDDIDREEVWGKSVLFNKFLESTLLESNVSIFVNTSLALEQLKVSLSPAWKDFLTQHNKLFKSIGLGAIQFSYLNDSFYTNAILNFNERTDDRDNKTPSVQTKLIASLPTQIISGPHLVRSHVDKQIEILLQDSSLTIYLISSEGKILWSKKLDGAITGQVKQVDFFNNGKLQYFVATKKQLFIIDRLGNNVNPFPSKSFSDEIQFSSVIDYDNSKKYRFLVSDRLGKLRMFDKELVNLEGWKPKNLEDGLATSMNHHRVRGKDFILAIRRDGLVYLMNRRGELEKGFPLNLEARPEGDYFVEIGSSLSESNFVCVSRDGYKIKFNTTGKIISKETLLKPSLTTQFALVSEATGKSYIVKRQDSKNLALLSPEGKEIVVNEYCGTNPTLVQFMDYGGGKKFYVITDLTQELSFVYDANGVEITKAPISGRAIAISAGRNDKPVTYTVSENTLSIER